MKALITHTCRCPVHIHTTPVPRTVDLIAGTRGPSFNATQTLGVIIRIAFTSSTRRPNDTFAMSRASNPLAKIRINDRAVIGTRGQNQTQQEQKERHRFHGSHYIRQKGLNSPKHPGTKYLPLCSVLVPCALAKTGVSSPDVSAGDPEVHAISTFLVPRLHVDDFVFLEMKSKPPA